MKVREIEFIQYGVTNIHPFAAVFMLCMIALVFAPKRTTALLGVLLVCVFMPMQQRLVVGGLDFNMLRLIMIVAWVRVLVMGDYRTFKPNKLDRIIGLWVLLGAMVFVMRVGSGAIVNRLGYMFDALSAYFLIRMLVQTRPQVFALWKHLAWISLLLAPFLVYESLSRYNVFGIFNYSGFELVTVRDGRARSQGPFSHPVLVGTFGAVLLPVFVGIVFGRKKGRAFFVSACIASMVLIVAAGSSGPVMALGVGVLGWGLWRFRKHMPVILWTTFFMAIVIHFVREKPVWHLIARLSSIVGGTGYHRYMLIDAFVRRFNEWWLLGTDNTAYWGWGLQDTTNQYVKEGIRGGLITLILFIILLRVAFVQLKVARKAYERFEGRNSLWPLIAWGSAVSLAAHCASFISVSYFGQLSQFFLFFVATVPAFARFKRPKRVKSRAAKASVSRAPPRVLRQTG